MELLRHSVAGYVSALLLAGCLTSAPLPAEEVAEYGACEVDADCAVALNGCCCELVAVATAREQEFRELFQCDYACACPRRPRVCAVCEAGQCVIARVETDRCPDLERP